MREKPPALAGFILGVCHVGSLQHIAPAYSYEIVLLSKSSNPVVPEFRDAILTLKPEIPELTADYQLDLEGRIHGLRIVGNNLTRMTANQTAYVTRMDLIIEETVSKMN